MNRRSIETVLGVAALTLGLSGASIATGSDKPGYGETVQVPEVRQQQPTDVQPLPPASPGAAPMGEPIAITPPAPMQATRASAFSLVGRPVRNLQGQLLGEVDSLLVTQEGKVQAVILGSGGLFGMGVDRYEVPWSRVHWQNDGQYLAVDIAKDQVTSEFSAFEPIETEPESAREPIAREPIRKELR